MGLDMPSYVMVLEQLAQGCTNTTMTLHMHSVVQMYIDALATAGRRPASIPRSSSRASSSEAGAASPTAAGAPTWEAPSSRPATAAS